MEICDGGSEPPMQVWTQALSAVNLNIFILQVVTLCLFKAKSLYPAQISSKSVHPEVIGNWGVAQYTVNCNFPISRPTASLTLLDQAPH